MDEFFINTADISGAKVPSSHFRVVENVGNYAKYRERMSNE
jgi:hypothetical protein